MSIRVVSTSGSADAMASIHSQQMDRNAPVVAHLIQQDMFPIRVDSLMSRSFRKQNEISSR